MATCPHCSETFDHPGTEMLVAHKMDIEEAIGVEEFVQLECPACDAVLGYLGAAAAAST